MLKVGITGGIGSGKSWVCRVFQQLGVPLFEADLEVKKLYASDSGLKNELLSAFGSQTFHTDGGINTQFLKEVLVDAEKRNQLNKMVHPRVFERFHQWAQEQKAPYVIKEAAILFESGADKTVNKTIGVFAPLELRIARVLQRDARTREDILTLISMQLPDEELRAKVDYQILNDNQHAVITQVRDLHHILCNESRHF
jgi:dephospho-CoA kinase